MFREFNVKFEDVEMLGGTDNLLENTEITKVIVRGDSKMSSLDSTFKNCKELDTIDGELDLNGVSDIDKLLEGTELVKSINLKNVNNENISANNSFPYIEEIDISGELYNKKAIQNVIASKDWTFDNLTYSGTVGDNVVTKETNINDNNKVTIQDTLEQKARGFEIIGQTYENLVAGNGEVTLIDELTLESIDGSPNEFNPHIEQPVYVEVVEGQTLKDGGNIHSIGKLQDDGTYKIDILTKVDSRNICNEKNSDKTGRYFKYFNIEVKTNTQYTLSYWDALRQTGLITVKAYNFNNELIETKAIGYNWTATYTTPSNCAYIDVDIDSWWLDGILTNKPNVKFMVQEGKISSPIYEEMKSSTQSILLPQPLNKIGGIKDKFYWDEDKGHYCIEQNVITINDFSNVVFVVDNHKDKTVGFYSRNIVNDNIVGNGFTNVHTMVSSWGEYSNTDAMVCMVTEKKIFFRIDRTRLETIDNAGVKKFLKENNVTLYVQAIPNIIDLPHLNKKYSLDTYMSTTYLQCVDTTIQPSKLLLESDIVRYKPSALETNTDYTVQFECKEKSDKKIKLNLGGSEKEVDAIVGLNHVSITTPNELSKDRLFLSGVGNKVDNVMVVEGEMNQYPSYFDGVQSVGELQDDGSCKIDIISGNDFQNINLWDGKKVSDYKTDYVEIYDNTFSTNAYDMRVTEYDENYNIVTNEYITGSSNKILTTKSDKCKYIVINSNIFKPTDTYYVKEGLLVLSNRLVKFKEKPTGFKNILINSISLNSPLAKDDRLYWNKSNKRYEINRNGIIEVPIVEGDVVDLPRLYQRENTTLVVESGNIKPSNIKIEYSDLN